MKFLWPEMLWLLLIVPALVAAYFLFVRRERQRAIGIALGYGIFFLWLSGQIIVN